MKEILVESVYRKGNKKYGYKYIVKAESGYPIQLENAISTGEIILPNGISKK
jgi:hypothetical protein